MAVYVGWLFAVALVVALGGLTAKLAWDKGYRAWLVWFLFGLVMFLPALIVVLCLKNKQKTLQTATP